MKVDLQNDHIQVQVQTRLEGAMERVLLLSWTPESEDSKALSYCFLFHSEEIAFYNGNLREKQTIYATFKKLVRNSLSGRV